MQLNHSVNKVYDEPYTDVFIDMYKNKLDISFSKARYTMHVVLNKTATKVIETQCYLKHFPASPEALTKEATSLKVIKSVFNIK